MDTEARGRDHESEMGALDALSPETDPARDATHFRRILAMRKAIVATETELLEEVRAAREARDSWTITGAAMGTSRQGAQRRFGPALDKD